MTTVGPVSEESPRPFKVLSLRQLQWTTVVLPLVFLGVYYYLMVRTLHQFFHSWQGVVTFFVILAVAVSIFSRTVFGVIRRMQAEIEVLHEQTQALVVERERQHIAREMHDGLAQVLSFVNTKAQAAEILLARGDSATAREHISELSQAARRVYADVREGIVSLRVEVSGGRNLHEIVTEYVEEFRHFAHLAVEVSWDVRGDDPALPPVVEVQALRIVQEALSNVRRHARARTASVTFSRDGDALEICVRDDGRGFDPHSIARGEWPQFGLRAMRERAEAAGGRLEIESTPGRGTVVRAVFPGVLRPEPAAV